MKLFSSILFLFLFLSASLGQESETTPQNDASPIESLSPSKEQLPSIKPAKNVGEDEPEESHDHNTPAILNSTENAVAENGNSTTAVPEMSHDSSVTEETFPPEVTENDPFQQTTTLASTQAVENQAEKVEHNTEEPPAPESNPSTLEDAAKSDGPSTEEPHLETHPTELEPEVIHEETLETDTESSGNSTEHEEPSPTLEELPKSIEQERHDSESVQESELDLAPIHADDSATSSENTEHETSSPEPSPTPVVAEATIVHSNEGEVPEVSTTQPASSSLPNFRIEEGPLGIRRLSEYPQNASGHVEETSTVLDIAEGSEHDDDVFAADKGLFSAESSTKAKAEEPAHVVNSSAPLFPRIELPLTTEQEPVEDTTTVISTGMKHVEIAGTPEEITKVEEPQPTTEGELSLPQLPPRPTETSSESDSHSETDTNAESEPTHETLPEVPPTDVSTERMSGNESHEPKAEPEPKSEPEPTASHEHDTSPKEEAAPRPEPEPSASPEPTLVDNEHIHGQEHGEHGEISSSPDPEPKSEPEPAPLPNGESPGFEEDAKEDAKEEQTHEHVHEEHEHVMEKDPIPEPEHKADPQPEPEPKSEPEPSPEPQPEPKPEPEPTAELAPSDKNSVAEKEELVFSTPNPSEMENSLKTPFSLRFPNIDFSKEFEDPNSGMFKKLRDQVANDLRQNLLSVLGDNFLDFEITSMREGSVIVEGRILTKNELADAGAVASKLEEALRENGAQLGGNQVDLTRVSVNGIISKGLMDSSSGSITSTTNSGYIVFGAIAVGLLIIVFSVFAIILFGARKRKGFNLPCVNNRRTNGNLKLKEELSMAENGRSAYSANSGNVNLMGFGSTSKSSSALNGNSNVSTGNKTTGNSSTAPPMVTTLTVNG